MDFTLLQTWLRLPTGPWPPDHYTLLSLSPVDANPARIEQNVMERMDVLRRHQLRNPELVTEGMNRLAQALVCLSDSDERASYDARQIENLPAVVERRPDRATLSPPVENDWDELPYAFLDTAPAIAIHETVTPPAPAAIEIVEATVVAASPEVPKSRRWVYRRLAVLRRCTRAWDGLAPFLADPGELLDRPAAVFGFLQAVHDLKPSRLDLRGVLGGPGQPGGLALAVAALPLPTDVLRNLLPDQRMSLAVDWRRGRTVLENEMGRLRGMSRSFHPRPARVLVHRLGHWVSNTPEVLLFGLTAVAIVVALIRRGGAR